MKKILLLLFLLFILILHIYSNPIDAIQARNIAREFFLKKHLPITDSVEKNQARCKRNVQAKANSPYYIFNADKGYVIVSGNDNTPSILGYSMEDTFNADSIPDNLQALLDLYEEQINYIGSHNVNSIDRSSFIREPIAPLLTCKWAQNNPYNLKCPTYNGRHCVTGCLATALSQVMFYYKWPQETTQVIPGYNMNINGISTDIPSVPSGTKFDWEKMLPTYNGINADSTSMYAVATLMAAVGTALHMGYNTGTSEAFFSYYDVIPKKYFGYHENQRLIYRSDVENWEETIYNELACKRPVVYGGQSANGGHAFVVDGYDGDQLFHVDWGYGGSQGYYLLDVLNMSDFSGVNADYNGSGYSKSQCAIINLVPSGWTADADYTINDNEKVESKGIRIYGSQKSGQTQEILIDLTNKGAGLYSSLSLYGKNTSSSQQEFITNKGFTLKRRATRTASIPWTPNEAGTYLLYVKINNRILDSLTVAISAGLPSSNPTGLRLISIHLDGEDIESKRIDPIDSQSTIVDVIGETQTATISIRNAGSSRWDGNYRFDVCVYDTNINTYKLYQERIGSGWGTPGYTWNYEIPFTNLPFGKYRFEIYANDILIDDSWHFNIIEGVPAWTGPKERKMLKIINKKLEVPENILTVDLTGCNNLNIIPNSNPNTLYIYDYTQTPPKILDKRNILIKKNNSYTGSSIYLQDGYSYYSPFDYTAQSIIFNKHFDYSSTSDNIRWETFCLPFTASKSVSNSLNYKWSTNVNDNKGNYWLEKLSQIIDNTAYFVCEDEPQIIAWRPYIIAVPLNVNEMTFSAENVLISSSPTAMPRTKDYSFTSNLVQKESYDIYSIVSDNNRFMWSPTNQLSPFNSYIMPNGDYNRPEIICIQSEYVDVVEPTINRYKLTYIVDGTEYKAYEVEYGAAITLEPAPSKEGYTFSGWSEIPETMPAHDVTVSGSFSINKYKLTYVVDGAEYKTYEIEYGTAITPEAEPTKEGYIFSGWSEIPETMPAHNVAVTGTFSINKYKLTYVVDGAEYKTYEIEYGTAITPEAEPTKEGYTFSGWSEIPETMPAHDVTVSGSFSINKYKLTYTVDGAEYKTYEVEYGATITPEAEPTKEGHTFSGWSEIPETMPAHDVTVTGTFTINKYRLTYTVDGAEYKTYEVEYGATITPETEPTKEGYTFSGWSEVPETMPAHDVTVTGTFSINKYKLTYTVDGAEYKTYEIDYGAAITPEAEPTNEGYTFSGWSEIPETMPAHDVTVTGTFSINKYKLTYTVDGEEYKSYEVEYGATITPEAAPTKEGYTFSGWSEIPETMPAHDVTVTGTFTINKYRLTYTVDGAEYKTYEVEYGATITPETEPTKEGYTFSGWSEVPETMPAHDVTVTGTFSINKYKLTYTVDGAEYKTYEVEYGATITAEADPTKEGYTFSGWSEIPETMPAHDVMVNGMFSINKYKFTYTVDGEEYKTYEIEYNATITAEAEPTKEGYTFSGWSEIPSTMPPYDVTVTGSFSINSYKLTYMIDDKVYKETMYEYGATITPEPQPEGDYQTFEWTDLPQTMPAHDVVVYASYASGIIEVLMASQHNVRIYSPNGKKLNKLQKGLNIVILCDGTIKKVIMK